MAGIKGTTYTLRGEENAVGLHGNLWGFNRVLSSAGTVYSPAQQARIGRSSNCWINAQMIQQTSGHNPIFRMSGCQRVCRCIPSRANSYRRALRRSKTSENLRARSICRGWLPKTGSSIPTTPFFVAGSIRDKNGVLTQESEPRQMASEQEALDAARAMARSDYAGVIFWKHSAHFAGGRDETTKVLYRVGEVPVLE